MKKLIIFSSIILLALLSFIAIAGFGEEAHGLTMNGGGATGDEAGVVINVTSNLTLINLTRVNGVTGEKVYVRNYSGSLLITSTFVGNVANLSLNLTAGESYNIEVNTTAGATYIPYCIPDTTLIPRQGFNLVWQNGSFDGIIGSNGQSFCNIESIVYRNNMLGTNGSTFNSTTYETSSENFVSNYTLDSQPSSVLLMFNRTQSYSATIENLTGNIFRFSRAIDIPLVYTNYPNFWFWNLTFANGTSILTNPLVQSRSTINFTLCSAAPQNVPYINFTFKNETTAQERVNASITSSTFTYWINGGSGVVNKTLTYSNLAENKEYTFCFSPAHKAISNLLSLSYDNAESEQRTYSPSTLTLTNTTTLTTLFLLPSSQGQYVTFQVINSAQQALSGVTVTVSRSGIGTIEVGTTDASGSVTFFLNPNFAYSFVFSKSGFEDFTTTITPTQTSYTITMGETSSSTNVTNPAKGMTAVVQPFDKTLSNGTTYNFNLTLNSTFWELDSWGFTLQNRSGFVFDSETSTDSDGGFLSTTLNTGQNKTIVMNYFWVINGEYNNATVIWTVINLADNGFSILQFFTDLRSYVSVGLFGLDDLGLALITFFAIFIISGVMSYKFGINSPAAIMGFIFSLTLFFDVGLGLIPNPIGAIPHAATFLMGVIMVAMIFREVGR